MSGSFSTFLSEIPGVSKITLKSLSELKKEESLILGFHYAVVPLL